MGGEHVIAHQKGQLSEYKNKTPYINTLLRFVPTLTHNSLSRKKLRIVCNSGNGCAGNIIDLLAPHLPFEQTTSTHLGKNALVIRVQPDEGVTLRFGAKVPGTAMEVRDVTMDFGYGHAFTESSPEAYERLILDVLLGDPPLFPRHEEVELSWKILDPITQYWAENGQPDQYRSGSWGPDSATQMLARDGRRWRRP